MEQVTLQQHREAVKSRFEKNLSQLAVHIGTGLHVSTIRAVEHGGEASAEDVKKYVDFVSAAEVAPKKSNRVDSRITIDVRRFIEGDAVSTEKEIGLALHKYCREKHVTMVNLAMHLGCSTGPIQAIFKGSMKPAKALKYINKSIEVGNFVKKELEASTNEATKALLEGGDETAGKKKKAKKAVDYSKYAGNLIDHEGKKVTLVEPYFLASADVTAREILQKMELSETEVLISAFKTSDGELVVAIQTAGTHNVKE